MQWSKSYLPKEVAATKVLEFVPQKLSLGTPEAAKEYVARKPGTDFRMNESVQVTTGVDQIERASDEERAEQRALEILAEVQEKAYAEAHALGLEEGRQKAFDEVSGVIAEKLGHLDEMLANFGKMKADILGSNEAHMVKLLYTMASKIAMQPLENDNNAVIEVLRKAVELASEEENVLVQMNPEQIEFIELLRQQTNRELEFLKKLRLEPNATIRPGGCVVETNYGEVDARIETRLNQLWETLADAVPRTKETLSEG